MCLTRRRIRSNNTSKQRKLKYQAKHTTLSSMFCQYVKNELANLTRRVLKELEKKNANTIGSNQDRLYSQFLQIKGLRVGGLHTKTQKGRQPLEAFSLILGKQIDVANLHLRNVEKKLQLPSYLSTPTWYFSLLQLD